MLFTRGVPDIDFILETRVDNSGHNYDAVGPDRLILHNVQARYLYISLVESVGQR